MYSSLINRPGGVEHNGLLLDQEEMLSILKLIDGFYHLPRKRKCYVVLPLRVLYLEEAVQDEEVELGVPSHCHPFLHAGQEPLHLWHVTHTHLGDSQHCNR